MHLLAIISALLGLAHARTVANQHLLHTTGEATDAEYAEYLEYLKALHADGAAYANSHFGYNYFTMFKPTASCSVLQRYPPGTQDGGKFACNMEALPEGAIIYSIGSEGNYLFENQMLALNKSFEIHTFDCFGDYGAKAPANVTFHKQCIAGRDEGAFRTLTSIMNELGHKRVDYLKMDVEGAEYYAVPHMLGLPRERLPIQFGLEIHPFSFWTWKQQRDLPTTRATTELMLSFHKMGYRLVSREDNILDRCCSEFLYILPDELPQIAPVAEAETEAKADA